MWIFPFSELALACFVLVWSFLGAELTKAMGVVHGSVECFRQVYIFVLVEGRNTLITARLYALFLLCLYYFGLFAFDHVETCASPTSTYV
jgi:hypothetical protein